MNKQQSVVISQVKAQKRNPARCAVFVGGEYAFSCAMDTVIQFGLQKGVRLTPELQRRIAGQESGFRLKQTALRYVLYKPRTEQQVREKLRTAGYDEGDIDTALEFLRDFAYLDDAAYARAFIRDYLLRKPSGRRKLHQELRKRGVTEQECADALLETFPTGETAELVHAAAAKKLRALAHKSPEKRRNSLVQYLQRQGFDWDAIKQVLEDFGEELQHETGA